MKKQYEQPTCEFVAWSNEDIVRTSVTITVNQPFSKDDFDNDDLFF